MLVQCNPKRFPYWSNFFTGQWGDRAIGQWESLHLLLSSPKPKLLFPHSSPSAKSRMKCDGQCRARRLTDNFIICIHMRTLPHHTTLPLCWHRPFACRSYTPFVPQHNGHLLLKKVPYSANSYPGACSAIVQQVRHGTLPSVSGTVAAASLPVMNNVLQSDGNNRSCLS